MLYKCFVFAGTQCIGSRTGTNRDHTPCQARWKDRHQRWTTVWNRPGKPVSSLDRNDTGQRRWGAAAKPKCGNCSLEKWPVTVFCFAGKLAEHNGMLPHGSLSLWIGGDPSSDLHGGVTLAGNGAVRERGLIQMSRGGEPTGPHEYTWTVPFHGNVSSLNLRLPPL